MLAVTLGLSMPGGIESWFLVAIAALLFIYWIRTLIEVIRANFPDPLTKVLWVAIIFIFGIIGAAVYNFWGKEPRQ